MRGLKPKEVSDVHPAKVASFTDAWIETQLRYYRVGINESHLLQMRGLKL